MSLKWRKKILLAKIETQSGTAQALVAADAVLAKDIEITPLAGDTVSRELERPYFGNSGGIQVNSHQTLAFSVELAGSGASGTAPAWGKLLQGCGLAEVVTANNKVDYTPISEGEQSLTLGLNIDGQLHTLVGARGNYTIEINVNQIPYIKFTFTGLYVSPSSTAAVVNPDYTRFKIPQTASNVDTPTFSLHGIANLALSAFSYDHANVITHRELINQSSEVIITDRQPTGSVTVDAPAFSALNLIEKVKLANADFANKVFSATSAEGALRIVHGRGPGKEIEINAPKTTLTAPSYAESDGAWQIQVPMAFQPVTGNDEIKITIR